MTTRETLMTLIYEALRAQNVWQNTRNTYSRTVTVDVAMLFGTLMQKLQKSERISRCDKSEDNQKAIDEIIDLLLEIYENIYNRTENLDD